MTLNDDLVVWLGNFGAGPEDKVADALLGPAIGAAQLNQVPGQKRRGERFRYRPVRFLSGPGWIMIARLRTTMIGFAS